VTIGHGGVEYPVSVLEGRAWKRKEVDKQLLTDLPAQNRSILISAISLPPAIPIEEYQNITVTIDESRFGILCTTGTDPIRFFLYGIGEEVIPGDGEDMLIDVGVGFDEDMLE